MDLSSLTLSRCGWMNRCKTLCVFLPVLFTFVLAADASLWPSYEDETIVERAEVIAVGHLKENSVQYVPHPNTPEEDKEYVEMQRRSRPDVTNPVPHPMSWEHRAMLVITQTIKGEPGGKEIPIIINYGLQPRIGGYETTGGGIADVRGERKDYPTNLVQIYRMPGTTIIGGEGPVVDDASKDHIWFLRRGGLYRRTLGTNDLGVADSQDIEPLELKEYLELYLSDHPEAAVKEYAEKHPEVSGRAEQWLIHQEIKRLVKIEDPALRFEKLLPHFLKQEAYPEIRQGLVSCGTVGGEKLVPIFQDPGHQDLRLTIISMFGEMNYRPAVPLLIQVLLEADRFWAEQTITNDWRKDQSGSALTQKQRDSSAEIYYSVAVLRDLHDPSALQAIALTKRRWESIPFADRRMLEECNGALDFESGLYLTGTVRNPAGEPVAGAIITVWPDFYSHPEAKTDAGGRYEIAWRLFKSATPSSFLLVARSEKQNLAVVRPLESGVTNLDVNLQPGLTVSTKVEDVNGMPVTNASVEVGVMSGNLRFFFHPDAQGRLEVPAVPKADCSYVLNVSAAGFSHDHREMSFHVGQTNRQYISADAVRHEPHLVTLNVSQTNRLDFPPVVLLRSSE